MFSFGRKSRLSRRRVEKQAWLATDGDFALRPCKVVDMSDHGAQLTLEQFDRLPKQFNITFSRARRTGLRCQVRWQRGRSIGVTFLK